VTVKSARESNSQFLMVEKQGAIATLFFTHQEARVFNYPGAEGRRWPEDAGGRHSVRLENKEA